MKLYGLSHCSTVKKAKNWLQENALDFDFHDLKQGINEDTLRRWIAQQGWEKVLNRKGTTWRHLTDTMKAQVVDANSALHLLQQYPSLIKRPILEWRDRIILGFDAATYAELFKAEATHHLPDATLALTQALMARRSVTPDDAGCMDLIMQRLEALGFVCEKLVFGSVTNLWARWGTQAPLVVFAGHTDVVPSGPSEKWRSPPFTPTMGEDGHLYGRGAADMKSAIAAWVVAVEQLFSQKLPLHGSIALLLTSDEEGDAVDGTVKVVEWLQAQGITLDACLVGEPTCSEVLGDTIKNGRRGSLTGYLTVQGVQGHVAYPHLAQNPIHQLAPALAELTQTEWDQGNEFFPPTTWQISNIHAGTGATNVIPGSLDMTFNFRFATASTPESLQSRTHAILDRHGVPYTLKWVLGGRPFLTGHGSLVNSLSHAITHVTGVKPSLSTTGGTSDGRFIAAICPQVVEFGVLNRTIHRVDECVSVADLTRLCAIYQQLLTNLLTGIEPHGI